MATYISQLPNDLKRELQYYKNYMLVNRILNVLEHFKVTMWAASIEEATDKTNKYTPLIIPSNIEFKIKGYHIHTFHYACEIHFTSPHLLTLQHFVQILNNIHARSPTDHFYVVHTDNIVSINGILSEERYTEKLLYYKTPRLTEILLMSNGIIK
jgi:hypothetical protein